MQPQVHSCPDNTYYWPAKQGCFSRYSCADDTYLDSTNPCEGTTYKNVPDPNSPDCSKYIYCSMGYAYNGNSFQYRLATSEQCPSGSAFRPNSQCEVGYKCSNYACPSEGLFVNPNSIDCTTYVNCWRLNYWGDNGPINELHANELSCPSNTKFNPQFNKCDSFYNCDGNDPHNGIDPCGAYNQANPLVANPYDSTQKSYISCKYSESGGYGSSGYGHIEGILKEDCPAKTYFTSLLGKCYSAHVPNENCSRDPCSSGPGKYVNYPSGGCQSFIECRDESTFSTLYEPTYEIRYCPPGTGFSPTVGKATGKCVSEYACPSFPSNYCYAAITTSTTTTTTTSAP